MRTEPPLAVGDFAGILPVSRETLDRFQAYLTLLGTWQQRINLVGGDSLRDPWRRHVLDCAQLFQHFPPNARVIVDMGSGAGLPGLVLAIMGAPEVHLVESDRRKAAFLYTAAGQLGLRVQVHACRIEAAPPVAADVVTSRALASLGRLVTLAARFRTKGTRYLFLKGRTAAAELTATPELRTMMVQLLPSISSPDGCIVAIDEVNRVDPERG